MGRGRKVRRGGEDREDVERMGKRTWGRGQKRWSGWGRGQKDGEEVRRGVVDGKEVEWMEKRWMMRREMMSALEDKGMGKRKRS